MRVLFLSLFLFFTTFLPVSASAEDGKAKIYAIKFDAEWCGSCKIIAPELKKAREKSDLDNKRVLFIKLDLTDKTTRYQSGLLASALGIGEYYQLNKGRTGFILLVDSETGKEVGKIKKDMNAGQIASTIEGLI